MVRPCSYGLILLLINSYYIYTKLKISKRLRKYDKKVSRTMFIKHF